MSVRCAPPLSISLFETRRPRNEPNPYLLPSLCIYNSAGNRAGGRLSMMGPEELGLKTLDLQKNRLEMNSQPQDGIPSTVPKEDHDVHNATASPSPILDFAQSDGWLESSGNSLGDEADLIRARQVMRRSNLLGKQVISIRSALSLGFISQLWVDTTSWMVLLVEVRPNLLSGESERFLLEDVSQVGDVVLVRDESVIQNEYNMVGLETLVGYKVVAPGRRNIGKVRGYTFDINSGAVEALELDSFGISVIPSSLVSTYALLVEDVVEVVSNAVVVHEDAASGIRRLSKGLLDNPSMGTCLDEIEEYSDFEKPSYIPRARRSSRSQKPSPRDWDWDDDWELPKDYL